jgi:hypothetical protein
MMKQLKKIAFVRKSTRSTYFVRAKNSDADTYEAIELLLSVIAKKWGGNFGTYTVDTWGGEHV